jgi:hypothetical protein
MNLVGGEKVAYQVDPLFQIRLPSKPPPKYRIYRMAGVIAGDYIPR